MTKSSEWQRLKKPARRGAKSVIKGAYKDIVTADGIFFATK
jgi:hypothetical protein